MKFECPACKIAFEFDWIGENEFISCPICGIDFKTAKKGRMLMLEPFEFGKHKTTPNLNTQPNSVVA